jgi:signal transduction histidine kinase
MISLRVFRAAPFRLAFVFTAALAGLTAVLFAYVYEETVRLEIISRNNYLESEAAQAVTLPEAQLLELVRNRIATDLRRNSFEELFDPRGEPVAGNLPIPPPGLRVDGVAHRMTIPVPDDPSQDEEIILVARRRPNGAVVILARDLDSVSALQTAMTSGFKRAMVPAIALSLAVGLVIAFKALERIKRLHLTIRRIRGGDLHERLPTLGSKDDLDQLAGQINDMLDEILTLIEEIRSVGDGIAHDLRTPLSVMQIRLERALIESDPTAVRSIVAQALDDLGHTQSTITSLLRIAEVEKSRRLEYIGPTDLGDIAQEVYDLYEPLADEKQIAMTLNRDGPAMIEADTEMLAEAIANIVDNAIKYTPPGGQVRIDVAEEDGVRLLRVHDSGFGIPPGERRKVTQRYYRMHRAPNARGSGLGLSLVAAIVKLHGFQLRFADVEKGACLEILAAAAPTVQPPNA